MRVFMLGWEFPPFISGGLCTACYGLTKAMDKLGIEVTFVLPKMVDARYASHVKLLGPGFGAQVFQFSELKNVKFRAITSSLQPYSTAQAYRQRLEEVLRQKRAGSLGAGSLP
ncbi:MAG: glycogen/starch synthase, partial [Sedimentisphaerales bacterium]|nr:glycogen/starch synthase [Sedimentisphaerales bacterium]